MNRRMFFVETVAVPAATALMSASHVRETEMEPVTLPIAQRQGGKPFLQTVSERKTIRNLGTAKLSPQQLSNLLWAAFGVNRADGRRTAPTAMNVQDIQIYVFLEEGVYCYDAAKHTLMPVAGGDRRARIGEGPEIATAAVGLVYVTNPDKYKAAGRGRSFEPALLTAWSNVHVGSIAQNVYLYAASEGLGTCFRAGLDVEGVSKLLNLSPVQTPLYTQTVGVPAGI